MTEKQSKKIQKKKVIKQNANRQKLSNGQALNHEHEKLIQWFRTVKFRKVLIGGVDELQLWKKLDELNQLYEASLSAERARYDALLEEQKKANNTMIHKYRKELEKRDSSGHSAGGTRS